MAITAECADKCAWRQGRCLTFNQSDEENCTHNINTEMRHIRVINIFSNMEKAVCFNRIENT